MRSQVAQEGLLEDRFVPAATLGGLNGALRLRNRSCSRFSGFWRRSWQVSKLHHSSHSFTFPDESHIIFIANDVLHTVNKQGWEQVSPQFQSPQFDNISDDDR